MRIDKYLKISRIIKRRTIAKEACDKERISLNGRVCKAGAEVCEGDVVEVRFGHTTFRVRVVSVEEHVRKENAENMYEVI